MKLLTFKNNVAHALIRSLPNKNKKRGKPSAEDQGEQQQARPKYKVTLRPVDEVR